MRNMEACIESGEEVDGDPRRPLLRDNYYLTIMNGKNYNKSSAQSLTDMQPQSAPG